MAHSDVIIMGTGAGGGTLAYRLAPSGKRALITASATWPRCRPQTITDSPGFSGKTSTS